MEKNNSMIFSFNKTHLVIQIMEKQENKEQYKFLKVV